MESNDVQQVSSNKFAKIPNTIVSLGLEQGDVLVLGHIKIHKNSQTGLCNPGIDLLSEESGYSKKFIMGSIRRLENAKLIEVKRVRGASNSYTFTEKGKKFERFAEKFLKIKDLSKNTKDFYMRVQQYLYVHEDGTADTTYSPAQLAKLTDLDTRSVKKYLEELCEKGYLVKEKAITTTSSGLANTKYIFFLETLGQTILYKLDDHEKRIQEQAEQLQQERILRAKLEKRVDYLERQLSLSNVKEVPYRKEFDF